MGVSLTRNTTPAAPATTTQATLNPNPSRAPRPLTNRYRRNARAQDYLSFADLLAQLASTVSCGGNILINVGPAADGSIPVPMQERLLQLGAWLRVNGAAVYATTPWRAQNETAAAAWYTAASAAPGADVYALLLRWPAGGVLRLTAPVAGAGARATLLTAGGAVACAVAGAPGGAPGVTITLPAYAPDLAGTGTDVAWAVRLEGVT
jgi:alpha-L-fucosidase